MREYYKENLNTIFESGNIENIPIDNLDTIKGLIEDPDLNERFYRRFNHNYESMNLETSDINMKVNDFIYRLNLLINKVLIPNHIDNFKETINGLLDDDIDLFSAVSFDDSDNEIIEDFEYMVNDRDIKI